MEVYVEFSALHFSSTHGSFFGTSHSWDSIAMMGNPREVSCLATLLLEGFPSGDAVRRRATELSMRMRLAGAAESEVATIGAAADRLMDPLGRFEESMRWLLLPEGTVARVSANSAVWAQRLAGLRDAVGKHSVAECKQHNELVLIGLAAFFDPTFQPGYSEFLRLAALSTDVAVSDAFWRMVEARALAIGDPRVSVETVRAARAGYQASALSRALVPIQAGLRRYEAPGAHAALEAMVTAKVPDRVLSEVRATLLGEIIQRCEHALAELEPRAEVTDSKGVHEQVVRAARERLDREVAMLAELGEAGGESCKRIRDAYAELLRSLAIRGVNLHGTDTESAALISRARSIAAGSALRARLDGDSKILAENAVFRKCFYCKLADADGDPVEVGLFRVTERHSRSNSFQSLRVPVPRCKGCASRQSKSVLLFLGCTVAGLAAGIGIGAAMNSGSYGRRSEPCVGIVVGGVLGIIAGALLAAMARSFMGLGDRANSEDFPPIARLLAEGWKVGDQPGNFD